VIFVSFSYHPCPHTISSPNRPISHWYENGTKFKNPWYENGTKFLAALQIPCCPPLGGRAPTHAPTPPPSRNRSPAPETFSSSSPPLAVALALGFFPLGASLGAVRPASASYFSPATQAGSRPIPARRRRRGGRGGNRGLSKQRGVRGGASGVVRLVWPWPSRPFRPIGPFMSRPLGRGCLPLTGGYGMALMGQRACRCQAPTCTFFRYDTTNEKCLKNRINIFVK
jgi:hypothetical protein